MLLLLGRKLLALLKLLLWLELLLLGKLLLLCRKILEVLELLLRVELLLLRGKLLLLLGGELLLPRRKLLLLLGPVELLPKALLLLGVEDFRECCWRLPRRTLHLQSLAPCPEVPLATWVGLGCSALKCTHQSEC